jgi:hypothetical protein
MCELKSTRKNPASAIYIHISEHQKRAQASRVMWQSYVANGRTAAESKRQW